MKKLKNIALTLLLAAYAASNTLSTYALNLNAGAAIAEIDKAKVFVLAVGGVATAVGCIWASGENIINR